jgi:hyperosmotically inducible protein
MNCTIVTFLTAALMLGVAAAQDQNKDQNKDQSKGKTTQGQQASAQQAIPALPEVKIVSGDRLTREVRHELLMLPYYSVFDDLKYRVDGNTVTLLGAVINPTLKSDAENAVKRIEGVERVDNQIEVLPASGMDDQIRRAVYHRIYGDSSLSRYAFGAVPPIHIIVKNGRVDLQGVVLNEMDKNLAGIRANGVPNTFQVTNNLMVENSNRAEK